MSSQNITITARLSSFVVAIDMKPGDLVAQNLSRERPLFASWRFLTTTDARLVAAIDKGVSIMILSGTIQNPFNKSIRLRRVLTPRGVGYMHEHELEMEPNEDVEWVDENGNAV